MAAEAGVAGSCEILGTRDDIPALVSGLHIVVSPSRQEGVPNTLIEAQAAGVPVAGSNVGGIPEVITANETGLLFPPNDPEALAAALLLLLRDRALAGRLSGAGRESVARRFSMEAAASRFEEIYRAASGERA